MYYRGLFVLYVYVGHILETLQDTPLSTRPMCTVYIGKYFFDIYTHFSRHRIVLRLTGDSAWNKKLPLEIVAYSLQVYNKLK